MLILNQSRPALYGPLTAFPFLADARRSTSPIVLSRSNNPPLYRPRTPVTFFNPPQTSGTALYSCAPTVQRFLAATAVVTPSSATTVSFLRLAIVFVAGGLFFSSAMATATAGYAIGKNNIRRFLEMTKIVWDGVWLTFVMGLSATKAVLFESSSTTDEHSPSTYRRYQEAWRVLRGKLGETRRKAVEGVQAIQREVQMCVAAVGPPGLIPLQYILDRQLQFTIASGIEEGLKEVLKQVEMANVKLQLSHFDAGSAGPKLESARVYDLGDSAMAFDFDVNWDSALEATIQARSSYWPSLPVTLHNVRFRGPVRVVLAPLTKDYPGFGAALVSFPSMPEIGMDVRVAGGEVTQVLPRVRAELLAAIERSIAESMIWPKRAVIPSYAIDDLDRPLLSAQELKQLETMDPLLRAEEALGARPVLRRELNHMSELLADNDHCGDQELLKSIVDLPMPSFKPDKLLGKEERPSKLQGASAASTLLDGAWNQKLQRAHHFIVQRHNEDVAKTHQFIKKWDLWNSMQKIQLQASEKLKDLQFRTLYRS